MPVLFMDEKPMVSESNVELMNMPNEQLRNYHFKMLLLLPISEGAYISDYLKDGKTYRQDRDTGAWAVRDDETGDIVDNGNDQSHSKPPEYDGSDLFKRRLLIAPSANSTIPVETIEQLLI